MLLKATRPIPRSAEALAREVAALRERLSRLSEASGGNRASPTRAGVGCGVAAHDGDR